MVLQKMRKAELARMVENHPTYVYSAHKPSTWTKAELIQWLTDARVGETDATSGGVVVTPADMI
jgi:hypothetical protein